jgi:hypothetical protein
MSIENDLVRDINDLHSDVGLRTLAVLKLMELRLRKIAGRLELLAAIFLLVLLLQACSSIGLL